MSSDTPVDLSGLHGELDKLKAQLCRCRHQGQCLACRGFEVLRQQAQTVVAAASQPVLMQVAQEAAVKDLMTQLSGMQEKLGDDPQLGELLSALVERIQDDLGGPEAVQTMMQGLGMFPGSNTKDIPPLDDQNSPPPPDEWGADEKPTDEDSTPKSPPS